MYGTNQSESGLERVMSAVPLPIQDQPSVRGKTAPGPARRPGAGWRWEEVGDSVCAIALAAAGVLGGLFLCEAVWRMPFH